MLATATYLRADPKVGCSRSARLQEGSAPPAPASAAKAATPAPATPARVAPERTASPIEAGAQRRVQVLGTAPWFRAKPALEGDDDNDEVDPREPVPEYRCKMATVSQCRDTNPNACSSQASELRDRARRYGKLANPPSIGMTVPVLENDVSTSTNGDTPQRSTLSVAVAPSAVGLRWRLTW